MTQQRGARMAGDGDKNADVALSLRVDFAPQGRLGPGKVALLEGISRTGSISAAGRDLKMSYKRAWDLVRDVNQLFHAPLVETQPGGANGGGARLTALGLDIVGHYRAIETKARDAALSHLRALQAAAKAGGSPGSSRNGV